MTKPADIARRIEKGMAEVLAVCNKALQDATPSEIVASPAPIRNYDTAKGLAIIALGYLRAGQVLRAMEAEAAAWQCYHCAIAGSALPYINKAINYSDSQRKRAKHPRKPSEITAIIKRLAARDEPAKSLFNAFIGELDAHGFDVRDISGGSTIALVCDGKVMQMRTFENRISKARHPRADSVSR